MINTCAALADKLGWICDEDHNPTSSPAWIHIKWIKFWNETDKATFKCWLVSISQQLDKFSSNSYTAHPRTGITTRFNVPPMQIPASNSQAAARFVILPGENLRTISRANPPSERSLWGCHSSEPMISRLDHYASFILSDVLKSPPLVHRLANSTIYRNWLAK